MIEQITGKVAICEALDINAYNLSNGIGPFDCVLNVNYQEFPGEKELCEGLGIEYVWRPCPRKRSHTTEAMKNDLNLAAETLETLIKHYKRILVHCEAGIDRAPFVVAKFMVNSINLSLNDAYWVVKHHRKCTLEHYEWR